MKEYEIHVSASYKTDGGSKEWSAALWQVKSKHKIVSADGGFEVGKCVTLLFGLITVYDDYDEGRISVD